jgi:predicted nucleic acid-binding protein
VARLRNRGEAEGEGSEDQHGSATSAGGGLIAVLDTGGVEGLAPIDEERRARLRLLRDRADDLVLPAAVLAESVLTGHAGHDFHVRRLLDVVNIADVDASTGHAAGALRRAAMGAGMKPPPSGVDTVVATAADAYAAHDDVVVVTSDDGDFQMLGSLATNEARLSVLVV